MPSTSRPDRRPLIVIPAKAGIHAGDAGAADKWIPAFAGMTIYSTSREPYTVPKLNQPRLIEGGLDERGEQRVRLERLRLKLGMELDADEPGVVRNLDDLRQDTVGRHAGEAQPGRFEGIATGDVDLVAMAVPLADMGRAVDVGDAAVGVENGVVGAEP